MSALAMEQPEVLAAVAGGQFEDLGDLTEEERLPTDHTKAGEALARRICDVLRTPTIPRWLIVDYLERAVIALMVGKRGSYKSFLSMDWTGRIAKALPNVPDENGWTEAVFVVSGEGGDYDRRSRAWWNQFGDGRAIEDVPWYVVERRMDLSTVEGINALILECKRLKIKPVLFVLDTFSKLSGGIDENDNSQVKAFIGLLDNGLKRRFDATVLLVAHTGHGDQNRARGASALGADTDAEYIVTREESTGLVRLTRERFKASPELPPVAYKPEVVDLDYVDHNNRPVTSLVMREATEEMAKSVSKVPRGGNQRRMWDVLVDLCSGGARVPTSAAIERAAEALVKPEGKRDRRKELMTKALNDMAEVGLVHLAQDGTMVSLVRVVKAEEQFDESDGDEHLR
jgi:hypothetical protein